MLLVLPIRRINDSRSHPWKKLDYSWEFCVCVCFFFQWKRLDFLESSVRKLGCLFTWLFVLMRFFEANYYRNINERFSGSQGLRSCFKYHNWTACNRVFSEICVLSFPIRRFRSNSGISNNRVQKQERCVVIGRIRPAPFFSRFTMYTNFIISTQSSEQWSVGSCVDIARDFFCNDSRARVNIASRSISSVVFAINP